MYQGKHMKKTKKPAALLASLALVFVVAVAGTVAFLATQTNDVVNTFTPSSVPPTVVEDIEGNVKEKVVIENSGNTDAYIRATVVVNWLKKNAEDGYDVYGGKVPVRCDCKGKCSKGCDYSMNLPADTDPDTDGVQTNWVLGADGYYYYKLPVSGGKSTEALLTEGRVLNEAMLESGYKLSMEVLAQTIQAVPETVVGEVWSSGVSGVSTVNGVKTLTVIPPSGGTT